MPKYTRSRSYNSEAEVKSDPLCVCGHALHCHRGDCMVCTCKLFMHPEGTLMEYFE